MIATAIFNVDNSTITFDFEDYIKTELGLNLTDQSKKEGKLI